MLNGGITIPQPADASATATQPAGACHEDALRLFDLGYICLPVRPGGKYLDCDAMGYESLHFQTMHKPFVGLLFTAIPFQFSQHPPDRNTVSLWFKHHKGNMALLCGYRGLLVLDFDKTSMFEHWKAMYPKLAASVPVERSTHGYHVYLRSKTPTIHSRLYLNNRWAGDVLATGRCAVCSPSVLKSGHRYRWLDGQSPFEVEPQEIESLESISVHPSSPWRRMIDPLLGRNSFTPQ